VLYHAEHLDEDERFWEVCELTRIDASHNELTSVPAEIGRLTSLVVFKVRGNAVASLPEAMAELKNLQQLDLSRCMNTSKYNTLTCTSAATI
jgi:internalin A